MACGVLRNGTGGTNPCVGRRAGVVGVRARQVGNPCKVTTNGGGGNGVWGIAAAMLQW